MKSRKTLLEKIDIWAIQKGYTFNNVQGVIDCVIDYYKETGILVRNSQIVRIVKTLSQKYIPDCFV